MQILSGTFESLQWLLQGKLVQIQVDCARMCCLIANPTQEASTDVISVTQFDAKTLRCMLDFMYEGKYDASQLEKHEESKYDSDSGPGKTASSSSQKIVSMLTLNV